MGIQFLALQGSGGTAVPFQRSGMQAVAQVATSPADSLRLKRYEEHWRFYQGIQWSFQREDGEPLVTANYCRTIVNKKASWLVGKGMLLTVPQAVQMITLPKLKEVWKANNERKLLMEIAITGGVTGDVFVMVTYQPATPAMRFANPYLKGRIRLRLLSSEQCFPDWEPLNKEELRSFKIVTEVEDKREMPANVRPIRAASGEATGSIRKRRYIEIITPETITEGWEDSPLEMLTRPNDLGEIPVVHIANEPFPGEYWGMSDLDGIIDMQRELNEKLTDVSDIVNYHAAPITIITGAKAASLEKGAKSLWSGLPEGAKVFNLELGGDLPASHRYLELVRQIMMDIGGLPEGSLGRIQPISNTSAAALEVAFQPLVEATERKRPSYEAGIEKINYFILRIDQIANKTEYPTDLCKHCGGRILRFKVKGKDGVERIKEKCYLIDPQTLDFLDPDDVKVSIKREYSFGVETRKMPFGRVKEEYGHKSASYWDPEDRIDRKVEQEIKEQVQQAEAEQQQQAMFEQEQAGAEADHEREMELLQAKQGPAPSEEAE